MIKAETTENGVRASVSGTMYDIVKEYIAILEGLLKVDDLRLAVMEATELVLDNIIKEKENK